jgi:membrane-bound ClpP family serine protease
MRSKELKTHNLPGENQVLAQIDAKPNFLFMILILMGVAFFIFDHTNPYGVFVTIVAVIAMIYMPRVVMMEFYQDYLVMYNKADKTNCVLIYYDEVASWTYVWGANRDFLLVELSDGNEEIIEAFSKTIFESNMNRFLRNKHKKQ